MAAESLSEGHLVPSFPGEGVRHIVGSEAIPKAVLNAVFDEADRVAQLIADRQPLGITLNTYDPMVSFFEEPSTRTRFSFEFAARRLGFQVVTTEAGKVFSSKIKGESLRDTIINLGGYQPAAIMARFEDTGSAQQAAEVLDCPLINGGDGKGEHPTQTVVDLYTIRNHFGSIDGLTVALGGDLLNGRTVNSLAKKLCDYDVKLVLVSPDELRMDRAVISLLRERGVTVEETNEMNDGLSAANVVYWTRLQAERFGDDRTLKRQMIAEQEKFSIGLEQMTLMQKDAILLHPLPRVTPGFIDKEGDMLYPEILPEVDPDPRALYFKQSENGQPVRIALLRWALEPMYSVHGQFPPR